MGHETGNAPRPSGLILKFLRWFCDPRLVEDVEGDLTELYQFRAAAGKRKADWIFMKDVGMPQKNSFNCFHFHFWPAIPRQRSTIYTAS